MSYEQAIDDSHRGCFVFLVDQSYSMLEPAVGRDDRSKAEATADTLNACLDSLVAATPGSSRHFDVGVIGYGRDVRSGFPPPLDRQVLVPADDVARHPLTANGLAARDGRSGRTWVAPSATGGTPMTAALDLCRETLVAWVKANQRSFPPVVVNISDGEATDGDPEPAAARLRSLATDDGEVLLFNVSLSARPGRPVLFAAEESGLSHEAARRLFRLSSPLPSCMRRVAAGLGHPPPPDARGIACDADLPSLRTLLAVGTSPATGPSALTAPDRGGQR